MARLLNGLKATEFRTLRCLGFIIRYENELYHFIEERRSHIHLVYELPEYEDPLAAPITSQQLLSDPAYQSDEPPPLDERFGLASVLARSLMKCTLRVSCTATSLRRASSYGDKMSRKAYLNVSILVSLLSQVLRLLVPLATRGA